MRPLLLLLIFLSTLPGVPAQNAKPTDPFVKTKPGAKPDDRPVAKPVPVDPTATDPFVPEPLPMHMLFIFETYTLPQDALDTIHDEGPPPQVFYEHVRQLVDGGKATLDTVIALPTRSGQRATSESVDEVIYPTGFDPAQVRDEIAFPRSFETRPTGERIELDPVLSEDMKSVDINFAPDFTRLHGFVEHKADARSAGQLQPLFTSRRLTNAVSCPVGSPKLLGTFSTPQRTGLAEADGDGHVAVTFTVPHIVTVEGIKPAQEPKSDNIRMVFRFYSLPRATARDLLAVTTDADKLHELVRALPAADGKLERLITMQTRSGQRATIEECAENIYGTEFNPPQWPDHRYPEEKPAPAPAPQAATPLPKRGAAASLTAFEMRPLGWRIEVDPVLSPDSRVVDLNLAPMHTEFRDNLQGHALLARYPQMPVFAKQALTTAVTAAIGRQCFLGTMNAPRDTGVNGRKDDGRAWFAFVKVTLE